MSRCNYPLMLILGFMLGTLPARGADDSIDKPAGTWVWKAPPGDHDQYWAIANDAGKWSVKGWYKNAEGVETGSFVGVDVKYADGVLTYTHHYVKKNFDYKDNVPAMIKVDGDSMKYYWDPKNPKTERLLAKAPKPPANPIDGLVGTWKTKAKFAGYDQTITIEHDTKWSIKGTYLKDGEVVGTFVGEEVTFEKGLLSYRTKYIKKPDPNWGNDQPTLSSDGETIVLSFPINEGGKIVQAFERVPGDPKVVAAKPTTPVDPKTVPDMPTTPAKPMPETETKTEWTNDLKKMVIPDAPAVGMAVGREFKPTSAIYEADFKYLRFSQAGKKDGFPDLTFTIEFTGGVSKGKVPEGKTFTQALNAPANVNSMMFSISYLEEDGKGIPKPVGFTKGAVIVEFGKETRKTEKTKLFTKITATVPVKVYVCLPDKEKSFLAGTFEVKVSDKLK